jgi:hypothetical protein
MELTQPVSEPDGTVVWQPGAQFDQDDPALDDLPPGHVRPVVVEIDEPPAAAAAAAASGPTEVPASELERLRGQAERLGVKVDGRWSASRLQQEIAQHEGSST